MKRKASRQITEPPLKIRHFTRIDRASRAKIRITTERRGILKTETRTFDSGSLHVWLKELASTSVKQNFEQWLDQLRDQLEAWNIPSDRQYQWIQRPGHDWEPYVEETHSEAKLTSSHAIWYSRMKALTEPLSEKRQVGEALWDLLRLLEREGVDQHLWHIGRVVSSVSTLRIAGATNAIATAGIAARNGRALGPAAKRDKAAARQEVIRDIAAQMWVRAPKYVGDASNTALSIVGEVNQALASQRLLPAGKDGLSAKVIADHLRTIIRGKKG